MNKHNNILNTRDKIKTIPTQLEVQKTKRMKRKGTSG